MTAEGLVCVVDDDQSVRRGLYRLFLSAGKTAEMFASAEDYLARTASTGPVCLVLDVGMPGLNGLDLQAALETRGGGEQIVFLTGSRELEICKQAMKKGAVDFLTKPFDDSELLDAVSRGLAKARTYLQKRADRRAARAKVDAITPREFEVLRCVIAGLLNKQIASELNVAEKTVKIHRGRVMQKLEVTSVPDLVRLAQLAGVSPAPSGMGPKSTIQPNGRI